MDKVLILNELMKYKGFDSKSDFARFLRVPAQNVVNWYNRNTFDLEILILRFPEVRPLWLITGDGDMLINQNEILTGASSVQNEMSTAAPLGSKSGRILPVKMGVAGPSIHDIATGQDLRVITKDEILPDFTFAYEIQTDLLWPVYLPGDWLFISPCAPEELMSGKSYFIDTEKHGTMIKRVEIIGDKYILSLPLPKPGYPVLTLKAAEIRNFYKIVSRVVLADSCLSVAPNSLQIDEFMKFANDSLKQNHFAWEIQNKTIEVLSNLVNEFINYKKNEK